jgi:hypothetical protein
MVLLRSGFVIVDIQMSTLLSLVRTIVNVWLSIEVTAGAAEYEVEEPLEIVSAVEGDANRAFSIARLLNGHIRL